MSDDTPLRRNPGLLMILRADAVVNAAAGVVLLTAAAPLARALGLATTGPLLLVGALALVNGAEHWLVARSPRPSRSAVVAFATVDLVVAAVLLGLAAANPTGAETWMRWTMALVGDLSIVAGVLKLAGQRRHYEGSLATAARSATRSS